MDPLLNIACRAARRAGDMIIRAADRLDRLVITEKSEKNFATEIDIKAEQDIIQTILKAYPTHGILAEENGQVQEHPEYTWIIDPLDGTTNFIHGFPHFAVSIAVLYRGKLEHAVIYDPVRQEEFCASRGKGAHLNDRRIRVTQQAKLELCLLGTGHPYHAGERLLSYLKSFEKLSAEATGIRRTGSAALDLAYVAAGRLDGFWQVGLKPWDLAAGVLLVQEAGGLVSDFSGSENYMRNSEIVAANPKIFKLILQSLIAT